MAALAALEGGKSTGHGPFGPRPTLGGFSENVTIEGKRVQLVGKTFYEGHGSGSHPEKPARTVSSGSTLVTIEGIPVARIGDRIACGDYIAEGCTKVFIG